MTKPLETALIVQPAHIRGDDRARIVRLADGASVVVADGVGGRAGGSEAADLVVERAVQAFRSYRFDQTSQALSQQLTQIDEIIRADVDSGESTGVLASIVGDEIAGAAVGDSEAWLVLRDNYCDLSDRASKPFLGSGAAQPAPFSAKLGLGTLLIATDGLFKYADPDRICEVVRAPEVSLDSVAAQLVKAVQLPSGAFHDDIGIVLCRHKR